MRVNKGWMMGTCPMDTVLYECSVWPSYLGHEDHWDRSRLASLHAGNGGTRSLLLGSQLSHVRLLSQIFPICLNPNINLIIMTIGCFEVVGLTFVKNLIDEDPYKVF